MGGKRAWSYALEYLIIQKDRKYCDKAEGRAIVDLAFLHEQFVDAMGCLTLLAALLIALV